MNISTYIQNDLSARIESGVGLPCKPTLTALADFYRVSLMPVRTAVGKLTDQRIFHKDENGRLRINPTKIGTRPAPSPRSYVPPPTDWAKVVTDDVIVQSLRGRFTQLKLTATAERFGISRTLVHSIFHRLAGEGLLEHVPRCGWRIRPFREADLDAYLEVRAVLELRALELARPRLQASELQLLLDCNKPGFGQSPTRFDNGIHRYWIERSENRYIQDFFDRQGAYYAALFKHMKLDEPLLSELASRHREILMSLLQKNWPLARKALAADIRTPRPILRDTIQRLEAQAADSSARAS
jgi:DNA-binding GntR family transcriptional regulator